jgi:hypothetical protein
MDATPSQRHAASAPVDRIEVEPVVPRGMPAIEELESRRGVGGERVVVVQAAVP